MVELPDLKTVVFLFHPKICNLKSEIENRLCPSPKLTSRRLLSWRIWKSRMTNGACSRRRFPRLSPTSNNSTRSTQLRLSRRWAVLRRKAKKQNHGETIKFSLRWDKNSRWPKRPIPPPDLFAYLTHL